MKSEGINARHAGQLPYANGHIIEDLFGIANPFWIPKRRREFLGENLSPIKHFPPHDWEPARG